MQFRGIHNRWRILILLSVIFTLASATESLSASVTGDAAGVRPSNDAVGAAKPLARKHALLFSFIPFLSMIVPFILAVWIGYIVFKYRLSTVERIWTEHPGLEVFNLIRKDLHLDLPTLDSAVRAKYFETIGELILCLHHDVEDPALLADRVAYRRTTSMLFDQKHGQYLPPNIDLQSIPALEDAVPAKQVTKIDLDLVHASGSINSSQNPQAVVVSSSNPLEEPFLPSFDSNLSTAPSFATELSQLTPEDTLTKIVEGYEACRLTAALSTSHRKLYAGAIVEAFRSVIQFPTTWAQACDRSSEPELDDYQILPHPLYNENCYGREILPNGEYPDDVLMPIPPSAARLLQSVAGTNRSGDPFASMLSEPTFQRTHSSLFCCGACRASNCPTILPGVHRFIFAPWVVKDHKPEILRAALNFKYRWVARGALPITKIAQQISPDPAQMRASESTKR